MLRNSLAGSKLCHCFYLQECYCTLWPSEREETELIDERDNAEGKETARFLAPEISKFIAGRCKGYRTGMDKDEIFEAACHG